MGKTKIAINGFGRIGRNVAKVLLEKYEKKIELVAINDLSDAATLAHLFKYDSVYGVYPENVTATKNQIKIGKKKVYVYGNRNPAELPWKKHKIDIVLDCTGVFRTTEKCMAHIEAGAKKVIISAPAKDEETPTFVMGVNENKYKKSMQVVSNASCTTNCLAPIVKVIKDSYGIEHALMTTIHSYTASQNFVDAPHKDLRRARAAALSIVPTSTGAAKTVSKVIPGLEGKCDGIAFRIPTPTVSMVDLTFLTKKKIPSADKLNQQFIKASKKSMKDILDVSMDPLVSIDYRGNPYSSVVDGLSTMVQGNKYAKVLAWYDNEWGYSTRLADLAFYIGKKM